jgi:myo-inositol 2-dehydrogenase/D-chiro-inositol 1-dehydrogenase
VLRMGVIGVGRLGSLFARTLAAHPEVDALVLAGSRPDSADALAEELSVQTESSAEHVFRSVDAVVIASSTASHAELIRHAAAFGIPVFCEKPLTLDLSSTDAIIELVRSEGIQLQVGFQRRFEAGYRAARDLVQSGDVGDVYLVRTTSLDPAPSSESFVRTSGDLFRDLVIHDFDAIRFVTGQEIDEVFATGAAGFPVFDVYSHHHDAGIGAGSLRLSGGATATFAATRHNPAGYDIRMEIHGSADSIAVGWDERMPLRSVDPGVEPPAGLPYRDFLDRFSSAYRAEMHAFVDLALGRSPNPCPPEDARAAFVIALAAGRSAAEGRPVPISEFTVEPNWGTP